VAEFYPGSLQRVNSAASGNETIPEWRKRSRKFTIAGVEQEFFGTKELAEALNRTSITIRDWERQGKIPKATFVRPGKDARGKRRLYSLAQVEGIVKIAAEEGILDPTHKRPVTPDFSRKVLSLFRELARGRK
jgi:hypothetical protein